MSATVAAGALATVDFAPRAARLEALTLGAADLRTDALRKRVEAAKTLTRAKATLGEDSKDDATYIADLAAEVKQAHSAGTRTIVVMNRVGRAQRLYRALAKLVAGTPLALIHSRFRPGDRRAAQDAALASDWSGILVATQAIEAGVDISARCLVTELAPWPSLVQRFGRCNRRGEHADGLARVIWADVADALPYEPEALARARDLLASLADVGPRTLEAIPMPDAEPAIPVLRRRDLLELFDTEPDLAGHDLDVSRFIRATDGRDVQLAWRDLGKGAPGADAPAPHRDELCSVPIHEADKLLKKHKAWRWDGLEGEWTEAQRLVPGQTLLLDLTIGGYDPVLGWTGHGSHVPPPVPVVTGAPDADDREALSLGCDAFVTLTLHSNDVAEALDVLARQLIDSAPWNELRRAARWHDLGKVHPAFQEMLLSSVSAEADERQGGPWAKSDGRPGHRNQRRHFRHELASALALLAQGGSDLEAYLVAAHHGKLRLALRPRPTEKPPRDGRRFALGVWEGDVLPAADLGDGVISQGLSLSLELMELGDGVAGPSWASRTLGLLAEHGPFRLAYWESLIRIADWRGTARRRKTSASGTTGSQS
jgi:CRISPR-associated endonuclease/helicase Cas3